MGNTAHRIKHRTKYGANQIYRLYDAPDCDSAAMHVTDMFGGTIESVEAVHPLQRFMWAEQDIGDYKILD